MGDNQRRGVRRNSYMERMGFWGTGMAFKDCEAFMESMKKRGIGFLEMLAMEMKSEGKYVSRGLSFNGTEFMELKIPLTLAQTAVYDDAVSQFTCLPIGCVFRE
jgi:hypothetical protein